MVKILQYIAAIFTGIVNIGKYLISRRKIIWDWYKRWRKGKYEEKVDKAVASRDGKRIGDVMRDIIKKRNKRHRTS